LRASYLVAIFQPLVYQVTQLLIVVFVAKSESAVDGGSRVPSRLTTRFHGRWQDEGSENVRLVLQLVLQVNVRVASASRLRRTFDGCPGGKPNARRAELVLDSKWKDSRC
jgi:hypothetical protein